MEGIHASLRIVASFGVERDFQNGVQLGGTLVPLHLLYKYMGGRGATETEMTELKGQDDREWDGERRWRYKYGDERDEIKA